jgi:hypothetical protein
MSGRQREAATPPALESGTRMQPAATFAASYVYHGSDLIKSMQPRTTALSRATQVTRHTPTCLVSQGMSKHRHPYLPALSRYVKPPPLPPFPVKVCQKPTTHHMSRITLVYAQRSVPVHMTPHCFIPWLPKGHIRMCTRSPAILLTSVGKDVM